MIFLFTEVEVREVLEPIYVGKVADKYYLSKAQCKKLSLLYDPLFPPISF